MKPYQIADWDRFENNKSREYDRCSFVCLPNKQDGLGLAYVLAEPDGAAIFGIWTLVVQAASRQRRPRAGWLTDDGRPAGTPWAPEDLAFRWRRPVEEVQRMIEVMLRPKIGWLIGGDDRAVPAAGQLVPVQCPGKEGKGTKEGEGNGTAPPPVIDRPEAGQHDSQLAHVRDALEKLVLKAGPGEVREWANSCREAGCKTEAEDWAFLNWSVRRLRGGGINVRFARDVNPLLLAWSQWGRADHERQLRAAEGQEVVA